MASHHDAVSLDLNGVLSAADDYDAVAAQARGIRARVDAMQDPDWGVMGAVGLSAVRAGRVLIAQLCDQFDNAATQNADRMRRYVEHEAVTDSDHGDALGTASDQVR